MSLRSDASVDNGRIPGGNMSLRSDASDDNGR